MKNKLFLFLFLSSYLAHAGWYGGYDISDEVNSLKSNIFEAYSGGAPVIGSSTHQYLSILKLRLSKHPQYVSRSDDFSWIRHDIVLFRQIKKNFNSRDDFYGKEKILNSLKDLESLYLKILKL